MCNLYSIARGLRFGTLCFKARNSLLIALTSPRWLSFLVGAVVTGIGQARHVEFDRVAAFVASGHKATKDEAAQRQNDVAHLSSPGRHTCGTAPWPRVCRAGQTSLTMIASGPIAYDFHHFSSSRDLIPELCNFFKIMPEAATERPSGAPVIAESPYLALSPASTDATETLPQSDHPAPDVPYNSTFLLPNVGTLKQDATAHAAELAFAVIQLNCCMI
jgi:hypothetical protein